MAAAKAAKTRATERTYDAMPDRVDTRDWFYRPSLIALPDTLVNCHRVPAVLDQGQEGACTGFALSAVINYLLAQRRGKAAQKLPVSPHMLYQLARRYDEWPGEAYEGSSARGAMKAWVRHGVCEAQLWPATKTGVAQLTPAVLSNARLAPGGAFYRVSHREVRDMHAALAELGILYMTTMVHDGWGAPSGAPRTIRYEVDGKPRSIRLPVIARDGRANSGHAVAIVGYTGEGFIIQNSWGAGWGRGGFALLPYEDYMLHATDVWAAQLGVPVALDLWREGSADTTRGMARAERAIPLDDIRPFVVDVGNNGELSASGNYWTTKADVEALLGDIIPKAAAKWPKRRVLLYLHGGLNSEPDAAKRVIAFKDVMLENEIYPLHVMWESGAFETLRHIVHDLFSSADDDARAGFMRLVRDIVGEGRDWSLELTAASVGGKLWREMKENAWLSSNHAGQSGAMQIMAGALRAALAATKPTEAAKWELHVVAHSAGAIYAAHALPHLLGTGIPLKSFHLMAPAMTMALFKEKLMPHIAAGTCPRPETYILSDEAERNDCVGPYGKSLLYLVSNAFEPKRATPLLGMQAFLEKDKAVREMLAPGLVIAKQPREGAPGTSQSRTHGGFDNDKDTMNSILRNILGKKPKPEFSERDLVF